MTPDSVTLDCPAKVNLTLSVGPVDPDTGFHPLSSWMVAVNLHDHLRVRRLADDATTTTAIHFADDAPRAETVDWPLQRDLAVRAHAGYEQRLGRKLPVAIELTKRIPTGGGLGGGSSDAAGVIVALDQLFGAPLCAQQRHALACTLGSDVPFALSALTGTPSAVVSGGGEHVTPAPTPGGHLVLVIPPFGCPTGPVFAAFDRIPKHASQLDDAHHLQRAARTPFDHDGLINDLYTAAETVEPRLTGLLNAIRACVNLPPQLTGAGAACFVPADSANHAQRLARDLVNSHAPYLNDAAAVPVRFPHAAPTP